MAGDWIKMRSNLWDDPRICGMCDRLQASESTVIGAVYWLWSTADQHSADGHLPMMSPETIDRKTSLPGFANVMIEIGWLLTTDTGLQLPDFDKHNGASAKKRAQDARRKAETRASATKADRKSTLSATNADKKRTTTGAREREEKEKSQPPPLSSSSVSGWEKVEEEFSSLGIYQVRKLRESCEERGYTPKEVLQVIEYFDKHKTEQKWQVGALHGRLTQSSPTTRLAAGWPVQTDVPAPQQGRSTANTKRRSCNEKRTCKHCRDESVHVLYDDGRAVCRKCEKVYEYQITAEHKQKFK